MTIDIPVHSTGWALCDEYPSVPTHVDIELGRGYEGTIEQGMVLCVESCTGINDGRECVKIGNSGSGG